MKNKYLLACGILASGFFHQAALADFQQGLQDTLTTAFNNTSDIPGVAVAVATPDQGVVFTGVGIGNTETGEVVNINQRFRLASVSKAYTGALIMKLQEAGYLNVDDKLSDHLYISGLPNADTITLRQLLDHSAGVYDHINGSNDFWSIALDPYKVWTSSEIVQYPIDYGSTHQPGTAYSYSNTGTYILGMVIETVTGLTLADAFDQWLIQPLSLTDTFLDDWSTPSNTITDLAANSRAYEFHKTGIGAAGAVVATPSDAAVLAREVYGARYISAASVTEMTTPSANNSSYGLSTRLWPASTHRYQHVGHTGSLSGYNAVVKYIPEFDVSIMVSANGYAKKSSNWYSLVNDVLYYVGDWYANNTAPTCPAPAVDEVTIDNDGAMVNGSWVTNTKGSKHYGNSYLSDNDSQKGSLDVAYAFTGLAEGVWEVLEYHPEAKHGSTSSPVMINTSGASYAASINHAGNGSQWNSLGEYTVDSAGQLDVTLSNTNTSGEVLADAIRVRFKDCL
ncbi:Beta-lactamase [Saliniradius amylolyticus]|uniref:Beta-lactamase n=1 Tax=Saliniradius amylolyticus TaxID=2183582 RepID=A0A2S2E4B5_9ALTE|nr:serine hydrolase [Saliniradius amylolyticus]AWL12439.1 Beta-lactamase [Saliniradius amylolyticus]